MIPERQGTPMGQYKNYRGKQTNNYELYCDLNLLTEKIVYFNRPDMTMVDKANKETAFIDTVIRLTI